MNGLHATFFTVAAAVVVLVSCASGPDDAGTILSGEVSGTESALIQGTSQDELWHDKTITYCFEQPLLAQMPRSVRARVATQGELDDRWNRRVSEFVAAVEATWGALHVIELTPQVGCTPGAIPIHYAIDTPTGGYAAIGRDGALSTGIQMDSEFLGDNYSSGQGTYHTYCAAHEMGHALGFRHEQDRSDSSCHVSQDFSGTGIPLTGYDADSIMNYCNDQNTRLSALDRSGFIRAYAFLSSTPAPPPAHDD